jgi:hypothetical protein
VVDGPPVYGWFTEGFDKLASLADEKAAAIWKAWAILNRGCSLALIDRPSDAVETISTGINAWRATGAAAYTPLWLSHLAAAYADLNRFADALTHIAEALKTIEITGERWCEAPAVRLTSEQAVRALAAPCDLKGALEIGLRAASGSGDNRAISRDLKEAKALLEELGA